MQEKNNLTYWLIACCLVLILLDNFGKLNTVKKPFDRTILPIKKNIFSVYSFSSNFLSLVSNYPKLSQTAKDLASLKQDREELSLQAALLSGENQKLRLQLEAPLPAVYKYIPAHVVSFSRFLEIDAGEKENVKIDMPVVDGKTLIGKIKSVNPYRSLVILPSDLESAIPVKTLRETRGVAVGQSAGTIVFDKVLQKDPLFLGDQVVTSGEDGFPPNLLFGKVVHIISDETGVYKKAKIEPVVNYGEEKFVFVISSGD